MGRIHVRRVEHEHVPVRVSEGRGLVYVPLAVNAVVDDSLAPAVLRQRRYPRVRAAVDKTNHHGATFDRTGPESGPEAAVNTSVSPLPSGTSSLSPAFSVTPAKCRIMNFVLPAGGVAAVKVSSQTPPPRFEPEPGRNSRAGLTGTSEPNRLLKKPVEAPPKK
jgi:hypothetical protein